MHKCLCVLYMRGHCVRIMWATLVAVDGHGTVPLVVPGLAGIGTVDRDLVVVGSQPVAVCVCIGEQTTL